MSSHMRRDLDTFYPEQERNLFQIRLLHIHNLAQKQLQRRFTPIRFFLGTSRYCSKVNTTCTEALYHVLLEAEMKSAQTDCTFDHTRRYAHEMRCTTMLPFLNITRDPTISASDQLCSHHLETAKMSYQAFLRVRTNHYPKGSRAPYWGRLLIYAVYYLRRWLFLGW